jgi:phosphoribosylformylglycinamidine synthase I
MRNPNVCVLRTAGTNCDKETAFAFTSVGAQVKLTHINDLVGGRDCLDNYQILAIPGGFSYGDDVAAGKILANELKNKLAADILKFISEGKLVIGICNGFQILVKSGLLPGNQRLEQEASLVINDSAKFEDRWVYLRNTQYAIRNTNTRCVWTSGLPEVIYLPVAHGEGKFIVKDSRVLKRLKEKRQIVFMYCDEKGSPTGYPGNPNGSVDNIAGICDESGRVLGLMPHPERHIVLTQHPGWTRTKGKERTTDGLFIFKNGVDYASKNL